MRGNDNSSNDGGTSMFEAIKKRLAFYSVSIAARCALRRFKPVVVLITGSAGKSMVKEAIGAILNHSRRYEGAVRKSPEAVPGCLRGYILPLTILKEWTADDFAPFCLPHKSIGGRIRRTIVWLRCFIRIIEIIAYVPIRYPRVLVFEYGVDRALVLRNLLPFMRPTVGIVTMLSLPPPHSELWEGTDGVLREKARIVEALASRGAAILNYDDKTVLSLKEKTRARVVTFGFSEGADMRIIEFQNHFEEINPGISFKLEHGGNVVPVMMKNVFGKGHCYGAAAAACAGLVFGLHLVEISEALGTFTYSGRIGMQRVPGIKKSFLLDSSYHACPASLAEALLVLKEFGSGRKVAVIGDMVGLGPETIEAHGKVGRDVAGFCGLLVTVGPRGKFIARAAELGGMSEHYIVACDTAAEAARELQQRMQKGDSVLISGSKEMGLDKVVEEVREEVERN
ncbi:hypothetical protein HY504_02020 [Candidatus Wolfebacteria bacterium]|nr:hypothetical protein [Candidatus Wolfebacteria bacterium]